MKKGTVPHTWTPERDAVLAEAVSAALAAGETVREGIRAAAEKIGVGFYAAEYRYYHRPARAGSPNLRDALLKRLGANGRMSSKDIEQAAGEGESGYHHALSTLGNMHRSGEVAAYRELLERVRHLVQDKKHMEAKLAAAESKVRDLEAVLASLEEVLVA